MTCYKRNQDCFDFSPNYFFVPVTKWKWKPNPTISRYTVRRRRPGCKPTPERYCTVTALQLFNEISITKIINDRDMLRCDELWPQQTQDYIIDRPTDGILFWWHRMLRNGDFLKKASEFAVQKRASKSILSPLSVRCTVFLLMWIRVRKGKVRH